MKKIIITFAFLLGLNIAFSQVYSPYYEKANMQLSELVKHFENVGQPLSEEQKVKMLKINMGILDKIEGVNSSNPTDDQRRNSMNEIKVTQEKFIDKQLTDSQKEKYKECLFSKTK